MDINLYGKDDLGLSDLEIEKGLLDSLKGKQPKKVLIIPPDITRLHSKAGFITNKYYHLLKNMAEIDILPALGTHVEMSKEEYSYMFGDIPYNKFLYHDWINDVEEIGKVPKEYVNDITDGMWNEYVTIEINKMIMNNNYDLILSIGQVVPHEVIGMANHSKNILVGCGGQKTINESHMIGAVYGMERMMGKDHSPVRKILDYGLQHFLKNLPIVFVLTVTTANKDNVYTHGLFIGSKRNIFENAVRESQKRNIDFIDKPIKKCVVYLDPKEFKSTWLGNKAIYRTRMAIQDGGELIILGPGIERFGEAKIIDSLIRKYGYNGRIKTLNALKDNLELQNNMSAAAHLIHGSSEDRFKITYAVNGLTENEIKDVNYDYINYNEAVKVYNPDMLTYGWNTLKNNEEIFYIPNPALGLWIDEKRFEKK